MWKKIINNYSINEQGVIKNDETERLLGQHISNKGYIYVIISINGKRKHLSVHREVAHFFISNPENKPQVNHRDGNKLNNKVENLEWCTRQENIDHAIKNGFINNFGEKSGKSKLTEKQVLEIREKYIPSKNQHDNKFSMNSLAKKYGVKYRCIYDIIHKITWKHTQE